MTPLTIVCFKWRPHAGYRSTFGPETVNVLRAMVRRHYPHPHDFLCVTDDPKGIESDIRIVPLWTDFSDLRSLYGDKNPSCYRRLRAFSPAIAEVFGPRFVMLDLDCVITGDLTPVWNRPEPFVIWGNTNARTLYNGSMMLMTAGARAKVWETFDPKTSPQQAYKAGQHGSDQGWISHCLGPGEATWTQADGVYSYRNDLKAHGHLPKDARIVLWHGIVDPWSPRGQQHEWVRAHYRANLAVSA